jgi:hypothetical protein
VAKKPDISPETDPAPAAMPQAAAPAQVNDAAPPQVDAGASALPEAAMPPAPAPPRSDLVSVPAGQPIPQEQMSDAATIAAGPSKESFHAKMRDLGVKETMARRDLLDLDPSDPNFRTKMANSQAMIELVRGEKAHFEQTHPWGSIESAHPGIFGKIGHAFGEIGNIAGDILAPGITTPIPGSQRNLQAQQQAAQAGVKEAGAEAGEAARTGLATAQAGAVPSEIAAREAGTEKTKAETEAMGEEKPNLQQSYADAVTDAIKRGADPAIDPHTQQIGDAITSLQKQPTSAAKAPHITYDQGIPVTVTDADQKVYDVNDPKLPPALKPLVEAAARAHGQAQTEQVNKEARAYSRANEMFDRKQDALSNSTKTMVEASPKVLELVDRTRKLIDQQVKTLGPLASRWNEFMAGKVGMPNQDFTKLRTNVGLLTTLLMRMHVGARGGEYIMKHFQDLIDTGKQSPDNLYAALDEIGRYAKDVQREGENKGVHTEHLGEGGGGGGEERKPAPKLGDVINGYRYKGGDPHKQESWEKGQAAK